MLDRLDWNLSDDELDESDNENDMSHITNLNANYHIMVNQIDNNLRPTRHLRIQFLANSRRIKDATTQHNLGLLLTWQFLLRCSYTSAAYEIAQRNWALQNNNAEDGIMLENQNEVDDEVIPLDNIQGPLLDNEEPILENNADQNANVCMTCLVATNNESTEQYLILPCGHAWVCNPCKVQLEHPNAICPLCRASDITFQRIFFL